jgi:uncharacterized membrane protein YvbJ
MEKKKILLFGVAFFLVLMGLSQLKIRLAVPPQPDQVVIIKQPPLDLDDPDQVAELIKKVDEMKMRGVR